MKRFPTRRQFRQWLMAKPKDEIIAEDWSCYTCPLAKFIVDIGIGDNPLISPWETLFRFREHDVARRMPRWACDFGYEIDKLGISLVWENRPVSAQDCLKVLARVPA